MRIPKHAGEAQRLGYSRYIDFWADGSLERQSDVFAELISLEAVQLRDFEEEGPFDDVWEAEFFEMIMDLAPAEIEDAVPGTFAAVIALARAGAVAVKSSNGRLIEEGPAKGKAEILFFAESAVINLVAAAANECGLTAAPLDRALWVLSGTRLQSFPDFAKRLQDRD